MFFASIYLFYWHKMRAAHDFDAITGMIKFTVDGIAPEFDVGLGW